MVKKITIIILFFLVNSSVCSKVGYFKENYIKTTYKIEMRDGTKLFTIVYTPKDQSEKYPILMLRTPYSISPYEEGEFRENLINKLLIEDKYIFVMQDVRGRFLSEGDFDNMRAYIPQKKHNKEIDETTDTYDTIEWLIKNLKNNNGKVGMWGISYPGFYAAMGLIDSHPALKAVSPQAPIADWFIGDDMHHNGAFTLALSFNFFSTFGLKRDTLTTKWPAGFEYDSPDMYTFFKNLGPLSNVNKKYFNNKVEFWNLLEKHDTYDDYWKSRNILPNLKNIKPAVLVVGGLYDAEDLYGPINIYKTIENNNIDNNTSIVLGPWMHGGWERMEGNGFGDFLFGINTSQYYQKEIECKFFSYYLKGKGEKPNFEAKVFDTGLNKWQSFDKWEPNNTFSSYLYLSNNNKLVWEKDKLINGFSEYSGNPKNPVPYTAKFHDSQLMYNKDYMIEDQRFAFTRNDVLFFETEPLKENITIAGSIIGELFVSTTGTDCDWVLKVIDVYPYNAENDGEAVNDVELGGYQRLIRYEIMRGKFRNNFEKPEPFTPGKVTEVIINLQDVLHTFKKGHKIMVQIQNSMFPLFDSNPNKFMNIFTAIESDFTTVTNKVYFTKEYPSEISFRILKN
ncbi:MAG: CocE/NonD family hydrolase [bacterium]